MFHVTRCPNCRTSFKLTDAHLTAYGGKVRCGRCAFVFDARDHMLSHGENQSPTTPAPAQTASTPPETATATQAATPIKAPPAPITKPAEEDNLYGLNDISIQLKATAETESSDGSLTDKSLRELADALKTPAPAEVQIPPPPPPAPEKAEEPGKTLLELNFDIAAQLEKAIEAASDFSNLPPVEATSPGNAAADAFSRSSFDDHKAGEYRPILTSEDEALLSLPPEPSPWRWLWLIPAFIACVALVAQAAYFFRSELVVQMPGLKSRFENLCARAGCEIALPAKQDFLRTEWSELTYLPDQPNQMQVNATLRNHAPFDQALPLLELTLTDDHDRVVAKKVFTPTQYLPDNGGKRPKALAANVDQRVFLQLQLDGAKSTGYSIYWFYPKPDR
ncbi:DUF3426 domain-containing protein [Parachitinimonas caeni]|uniref:DUF3426 domain-containing protein n=1 Tax=Parachitinimonas caeni TaxID=3031301 RepID=A0ABT7DVE7_9NEIS|nr:DUF3426 domain-containing protein [Parachitinimonas caeni]MDK2124016.1 DUF3426 domain-containing protein [Parachitinimonas caeni]